MSSGSDISIGSMDQAPESPSFPTVEPDMSDTNEESEDEFITSDEELLSGMISNDESRQHYGQATTMADHTDYFEKSITNAMESLQLDKSLVAQAQLSGRINNKNQQLIEVNEQLCSKLESLKQQYEYHIARNRLGVLERDLDNITSRIETLKNGSKKSVLFGNGKLGVAKKYPIEYNRAKDKVLDRVSDP
ncbi:hypothetical protein FT663_02750 [Candidozyma haemuli var. vulneris]|uniref:Biogenesis of lysosome-related organelles complex 1 subunit KXD1 n=1 Tax=Candidozyma haemuli TaxID=45357 RepID=A0A2V1AU89_9ASCO|nr:hypothetical protein CXQ85_000318 [[Candida] haemuloni]KAF3989386.1 hypothetical protein FT662_02839 [[Candida] haemuloni var. vulneris]KAF3991343.1 hypothetical protein FT663_02750 [[Candida] haemuloni var. vulneris]PVH21344.1 hypothetical protein CXQ85_000318 [[Candida] haemuloni]